MSFLHEVYSQIPKSSTLLDIGGSPTVHQHISARRKVKEIIFTDYLDSNIKQVNLWKNADPAAYDWDQYFEYARKLEQVEETHEAMKTSLRAKIKQTVQLDIPKKNCLYTHWTS